MLDPRNSPFAPMMTPGRFDRLDSCCLGARGSERPVQLPCISLCQAKYLAGSLCPSSLASRSYPTTDPRYLIHLGT